MFGVTGCGSDENTQLETEITQLETENTQLETEITQLQTRVDALEEQAKSRVTNLTLDPNSTISSSENDELRSLENEFDDQTDNDVQFQSRSKNAAPGIDASGAPSKADCDRRSESPPRPPRPPRPPPPQPPRPQRPPRPPRPPPSRPHRHQRPLDRSDYGDLFRSRLDLLDDLDLDLDDLRDRRYDKLLDELELLDDLDLDDLDRLYDKLLEELELDDLYLRYDLRHVINQCDA